MSNSLVLHHDNAFAFNIVLAVQHFLGSSNMVVIPHLTYSPDLTLYNFILFPKMKLHFKGYCFDIIEEDIQAKSQKMLC